MGQVSQMISDAGASRKTSMLARRLQSRVERHGAPRNMIELIDFLHRDTSFEPLLAQVLRACGESLSRTLEGEAELQTTDPNGVQLEMLTSDALGAHALTKKLLQYRAASKACASFFTVWCRFQLMVHDSHLGSDSWVSLCCLHMSQSGGRHRRRRSAS